MSGNHEYKVWAADDVVFLGWEDREKIRKIQKNRSGSRGIQAGRRRR